MKCNRRFARCAPPRPRHHARAPATHRATRLRPAVSAAGSLARSLARFLPASWPGKQSAGKPPAAKCSVPYGLIEEQVERLRKSSSNRLAAAGAAGHGGRPAVVWRLAAFVGGTGSMAPRFRVPYKHSADAAELDDSMVPSSQNEQDRKSVV